MSDLRSRARGARPEPTGNGRKGQAEPIISFDVGEDPEVVNVHLAWNRVMRFCRALTKGSTAEVKDKGTGRVLYTYQYRGVDDVVTLAGFAFRQFGIRVVPVDIQIEYRPSGQMLLSYATVTYEVTSLDGSSFRGVSRSEGIDNSDKSTVKAEQQAYRVFLTTALSLPTYDPTLDSDATPVLRPAPPTPFELRDEMLREDIRRDRLLAIHSELKRDRAMAETVVPVPDGQGGEREETLLDLNLRRGRERTAAEQVVMAPAPDAPADPEAPEED